MNKTQKNIILQTCYQVATIIIPFITAPYVTRVLGKGQLGIYTYTYSIVNFFMMLAMLGIENYGNRTIAKVRDNPEEVNVKFSEVFYCHLIPSLLALLVYVGFCFTLGGIYRIIGVIQTLYILADLCNINWFFAGMGLFKITVARNLSVKLLTVISIFLFVKTENDLLIYISIMAVGTFLGQSAVWTVRHKYARFVKVKLTNCLLHLKPMCILFVSVVALNIYRMIDKVMLGYDGQLEILGCYEYSDKILRMPISVIVAVGVVMLSKSSNMLVVDGEKKVIDLLHNTLKYITLLGSLVMFGMLSYGTDFAILFLGEEFAETGYLLAVLSFSFIFMTWNSVLRTQFFIPKGEDKSYTISVWIGAIVNILLNALLIPRYSAYGAAVATDVAYFSVTLSQLLFARKSIKPGTLIKTCWCPLVLGVIPTVIMYPISRLFDRNWLFFSIEVILFCVVFVGVTLIYWVMIKDPMYMKILRKITTDKLMK